MRKLLQCTINLFFLFTIVACSEQEKPVAGEFLLGNFGFDLKSNETYYLVVPIEWTGEPSVTIESIELINKEGTPITFKDDGLKYEIFGADPLKKSGVYGEREIGDIKSINNLEINKKGKIAIKLSTLNVKKDSDRRIKIIFDVNGEDKEEILEWKTLEHFSTEKN